MNMRYNPPKMIEGFAWGLVVEDHVLGDIMIREAISDEKDEGNLFYIYVGGKDTHHHTDTIDGALLVALGFKYDGPNSQWARFAQRMLSLDLVL